MATPELFSRLQADLHNLFVEPEQLLDGFFDSSAVGFSVLDRELRFLVINPTLARMNGIAPQTHLGRTVRELLGEIADTIEPLMHRVLLTGEPIVNFELSGILPSQEHPGHWIENYFPIKNSVGDVIRVGVIVIEITQQRAAERAQGLLLQDLHEEKGRLQTLLQISTLLASDLDLNQVFSRVSTLIRLVIGQEWTNISLLDPLSHSVVMHAVDFPIAPELIRCGETIPVEGTASGQTIVGGQPVIFSYAELATFRSSLLSRLLVHGIRSAVCVPLTTSRGTLGSLNLGSFSEGAFRQEDLGFLNTVAGLIALAIENSRDFREITELKDKLFQEKSYLEEEVRSELGSANIIGNSARLKHALDLAGRVAISNATVLVLGETGTGKELVAHAVHRLSSRKNAAFIKLNCAAIPSGLLESELFGHEKGAFTGATSQKLGRLELAHQGTLFLDEVGEIPLELQPKLLRVLQDGEFERLGSNYTRKVDIRLIAATNRDLAESVKERDFRADLYYRLNVFPILLPSLRERTTDIPMLVRHFVQKYARKMNKHISTIPQPTMDALMRWSWPGNIRELENFIERSVILTTGPALQAPSLDLEPRINPPLTENWDDIQRESIVRVLRDTNGNLSIAARRMGLERSTLQSMVHRLGISTNK